MRLCPECKTRTESRACEKCGTPTLLESALGGASQKPDPLIGQVFDERYSVVDRIGRGGMGSVYKARQLTMGRDVALKVLNPDLMEDADSAGRFVREAKVASRLRHPNTIVVYDFGHAPQGLYIAMELLEGETLYHRLRREKRLDVPTAARIGAAIASSLDEAHAQGIVHRDLKPANIFLARVHGGGEVVKVLDFGVARFFQDQATRSQDSLFETNRPMMVGTLQYMAPEQIRGQGVDARADLYALGIMLYEMVAGARPLDGDSPVNTMQRQLEDVAPRLGAGIAPGYADLVERLLAKAPETRPSSAAEVANALFGVAGVTHNELPVARASSRLIRMEVPSTPTPAVRSAASWDAMEDEGHGESAPMLATEAVSSSRIARPLPYGARGEHLRGGLRADGGPNDATSGLTDVRPSHAVERHVGISAGRRRSPLPTIIFALLTIAAVVGGVWFALTRNAHNASAPTAAQVTLDSDPPGAQVNDAATGKALGRTPLTLAAGTAERVLVGMDGYRGATVQLEFPDERGVSRRQPVTLERLPSIILESDPIGATVYWVDRSVALPGRTPMSWLVPNEALSLVDGVEVRFELAGYEARTERIKAKDLAEGRGVPPVRLAPAAAVPEPARTPEGKPRKTR